MLTYTTLRAVLLTFLCLTCLWLSIAFVVLDMWVRSAGALLMAVAALWLLLVISERSPM